MAENKKIDIENSYEYQYYEEEIEDKTTQFFIIDTHGAREQENEGFQEKDFVSYIWNLKQYKQVNEGDLFIYRRPQSSSEINGQFYFFGAGKFGEIKEKENGEVKADITKPLIFTDYVLKSELNDVEWFFKKRTRDDWQYFFNQYGMNKITKNDFLMLLEHSTSGNLSGEILRKDFKAEKKIEENIKNKNYYVEDKQISTTIRGYEHAVFARKVKSNYGYKCAITGIQTKEFLVASHIKPWSVDKYNRTNPRNGICLSSLMDKAFDQGYITISTDFKVIISKKVKKDKYLDQELSKFNGNKIDFPSKKAPDKEFLEWHKEHIFKNNK